MKAEYIDMGVAFSDTRWFQVSMAKVVFHLNKLVRFAYDNTVVNPLGRKRW